MGGDDNESCQMGFQQCAEMMLNCPSSGMNSRPLSENVEPTSMSSAYGSSWDPIVSLSQSGSFGGVSSVVSQGDLTKSSYPMLLETQGISSSSHLVNYPLDANLTQMMPKYPMFGGANFPEIGNPLGLPVAIQNPNLLFLQNYTSNKTGADEKSCANAVQVEGDRQIPEGRALGASQDGKRKRDSNSPCPPNKNGEGDCQKDHSSENSSAKEPEDKRQKSEQHATGNSPGKQPDKQVKDNSQGEEAPKQNYIHVRARRGQATNSHSLAERVRREKISERMRLLQELVPGCNKITGKAVMLDEIINYVQSLQQQVEFLSMKLATVNPELNFDIDRLLSKEILHSRVSGTPILGFDQGMSSSHGFTHGFHQGSLATLPNPTSQYHRMSQVSWDGDLQNLLHMGFHPSPSVGSLGPNGNSKTEL